MHFNKNIAILLNIFFLIILISCEDLPCRLNTGNPSLKIGYFHNTGNNNHLLYTEINDYYMLNNEEDTIETPFLNNSYSTELILSPYDDIVSIHLHFNEIQIPIYENEEIIVDTSYLRDIALTLNLRYSTDIELLSEECGFVNRFYLETLNESNSVSDSIKVLHNLVSRKQSETDEDNTYHIAVYF